MNIYVVKSNNQVEKLSVVGGSEDDYAGQRYNGDTYIIPKDCVFRSPHEAQDFADENREYELCTPVRITNDN